MRCFDNDNIVHVDGNVNPIRDKETIDIELQLKDLETVDFLKIDVEGYEPQVLAGAAESLKKTKVLYIEFCTNNLTQLHHNQSDFVQLLNKNFNLYVYSQNKLADFVFDGTKEYAVNLLCLKK